MFYANKTFETGTHMCIGSVRVRRLDPLTTRIKSLSNETLGTLSSPNANLLLCVEGSSKMGKCKMSHCM